MSQYLKKYEYKNAETKDLWAELNNVAQDLPESIATIMDTWTTQPGYPVVYYDGHTLKQKRFLLNSTGTVG